MRTAQIQDPIEVKLPSISTVLKNVVAPAIIFAMGPTAQQTGVGMRSWTSMRDLFSRGGFAFDPTIMVAMRVVLYRSCTLIVKGKVCPQYGLHQLATKGKK